MFYRYVDDALVVWEKVPPEPEEEGMNVIEGETEKEHAEERGRTQHKGMMQENEIEGEMLTQNRSNEVKRGIDSERSEQEIEINSQETSRAKEMSITQEGEESQTRGGEGIKRPR